jgi:Cu(I)/Ag(I) efflux system membrane fusion protein
MSKLRALILIISALIVCFLAGTWYGRGPERPVEARATPKATRFVCPMHPQYTSDRPGTAPCCGMRLVPAEEAVKGSLQPPGTVHISSDKQQVIGIETVAAANSSAARTIRTTGRIAADENRLYRLNTSTELWVRKVYPPSAGSVVRKDEPLVEVYTTNLLGAINAYIYALNTRDRTALAQAGPAQVAAVDLQVRQAVESLRNLGVAESDIAAVERRREPMSQITFRSPVDGYVLARGVTRGQWVPAATELYQIADLSRVWIYADAFEGEVEQFHSGAAVKVALPNRERTFTAHMSDVAPVFDSASRSSRIRLELDNQGFTLRPGMFVDLEFALAKASCLTVPAESVIDSGRRKVVYVDRGNGFFEPREIHTGSRFDGRVEINSGLAPGERVVVAGNFLIDSESRMRASASTRVSGHKDAVCGMEVNGSPNPARTVTYGGREYRFCSEDCKHSFEKNPEKYTGSAAGRS